MSAFRVSLLIFGLVCVALLQGCATTSWVKRTPQEDSRYKYYVGRSYNARSATDGLEAARADAKAKATEENFGAQVAFQRDTHETIDAAQVIERSRVISKSVHLEGFEEVEVHQDESDEGHFNTAILFRYPKAAIETERQRLAANPQSEEAIKFDPVDTTPKPHPTTVDHRAVQSTFVIGAGVSGQGTTMSDVDNSTVNFRLQTEWRLSRSVGLDVFGEFGSKSITYTNGTLKMDKDVLGLGVPLYWSSADRSSWTTFVEPTVQAFRTGFSYSDTSGGNASSISKWQFGPGINIGAQVRYLSWERSGLSVRPQVGIMSPMATSGINGATAVQGALIFQWEFFNK